MSKSSALATVVVVFHNEQANLKDLLYSFESELRDNGGLIWNILFIDNESTDGSPDLVRTWSKSQKSTKVQLVRRNQNHMGLARQQALALSKTPWIVFVDADTTLKRGWAQGVERALSCRLDNIAAIGGRSDYYGSSDWSIFARDLANRFPMGSKSERKSEVVHVPTNNMILNRSLALAVGGFHPFYDRVGEDLDLCVRLRKRGKVIYDPSFSVRHRLPRHSFNWYQKMMGYGRAQSYVFLMNRGGVPSVKFLPLFFCICCVGIVIGWPGLFSLLTALCLVIPRCRFLALSLLFYGVGEAVGAVKFLVFKKNYERLVVKAGRAS